MTQIQYVTEKEMYRRTHVKNALGYTFPKKDTILIRKGLSKDKKREVIDHELEHLEQGEEGPFIGGMLASTGISALGSYLGGREARKGSDRASELQLHQSNIARGDLAPYREFGSNALADYQRWRDVGQPADPTSEEVMAQPGFGSRQAAIENSAIARGGLLSGNAMRAMSEFGADEYERLRNRKMQDWQNEYNRRMAEINLGYGAAGGSAGIAQNLGQQLGSNALASGRASGQMYRDVAGSIAGGIGAYQGQKQWQDFLDRTYQ